jgi:hypothetical protein
MIQKKPGLSDFLVDFKIFSICNFKYLYHVQAILLLAITTAGMAQDNPSDVSQSPDSTNAVSANSGSTENNQSLQQALPTLQVPEDLQKSKLPSEQNNTFQADTQDLETSVSQQDSITQPVQSNGSDAADPAAITPGNSAPEQAGSLAANAAGADTSGAAAPDEGDKTGCEACNRRMEDALQRIETEIIRVNEQQQRLQEIQQILMENNEFLPPEDQGTNQMTNHTTNQATEQTNSSESIQNTPSPGENSPSKANPLDEHGNNLNSQAFGSTTPDDKK